MQLVKRYIPIAILPVALLAAGLHTFILVDIAGFGMELALTDAMPATLMLAAAVWPLLLILNAYPTRVGIVLYALFMATIFSGIACFSVMLFLKWYAGKNDAAYYNWVTDTALLRYLYFWIICSWAAVAAALHKKAADLQQKFKQQTDAASLLREAELYKLRQQLQPHFLYNSLNSISALTMIAPEKAQEMIGKLSDFLRTSVKRESQDLTPVDDELRYIETYLSIESIRFGDRLQVVFEKEYTDDAQIPSFLLQPLLENAIKFGLYGKTGSVTITVHIALQSSILIITISNPYDPQGQLPKGTGFGLEGVRRRLYLLYARTDLLETQKELDIFTTILKIPQAHVQSDTDR